MISLTGFLLGKFNLQNFHSVKFTIHVPQTLDNNNNNKYINELAELDVLTLLTATLLLTHLYSLVIHAMVILI